MGALVGDAVAANRCERREDERRGDELLVAAARAGLLERLSAGLVHEARNPLNAMAIHLEVLADKLRDETTGELPPQYARNLDSARNQVRRLDDLLRRWGEFSCERMVDGDLAACAQRAVALCEYHLRRAGLEVDLAVASGLGIRSPALVCQALVEMLLFAAAHVPAGTRLELAGIADGDFVCVSIRGASADADPSTLPGESLAVDALRAVVRTLGGSIAPPGAAPWCWTLRVPRAGVQQNVVI